MQSSAQLAEAMAQLRLPLKEAQLKTRVAFNHGK